MGRPGVSEPTEFLCVDLKAPESFVLKDAFAPLGDSFTEPKQFMDSNQAFTLASSNAFANKRRAARGIRATRTRPTVKRSTSCRGIPELRTLPNIRASMSESDEERVSSGKVKIPRSKSVRVGPRSSRRGRSLRRSGRGLH